MSTILFVAPRYHTNQVPIVEGLIDKGHNVHFLVMYRGNSENYEKLNPHTMPPSLITKIRYNKIRKEKGDMFAENWLLRHYKPGYVTVLQYLISINPDIVILRERSRQSRIVFICCRILGIKKVILYNQKPIYNDEIKNPIKKLLSKVVFPKIRITPVKYIKLLSKTNTYIPSEKNHDYFLPFVQTTSNENRYYTKDRVIRILDVGKYRDYKNHEILIEAVGLMQEYTNIHVTIVGQVSNKNEENYFENLNSMIINKNLQDKVSLLRNIPYKEMQNLYLQNDIFILPSKKEVASISILEAMAHGLCVISTDNNGTAFYVIEGTAGIVFDHTSSHDLAEKISYFVKNPEQIQFYGNNALDYIQNHCQFIKYYEGLNDLLWKEFKFKL